jgi:hypothetical protein
LSYEEFELLATILCEHIAKRITTEAVFTFLVGPLIASWALFVIDWLWVQWLPPLLPEYLAGVIIALRSTITVTVILMAVVPQILKAFDRKVEYTHAKKAA